MGSRRKSTALSFCLLVSRSHSINLQLLYAGKLSALA